MAFDSAFFPAWQPRALAVLRIVTAYLFLQHGTSKLLGIPAVEMFKAGVPLLSMIGIAGLIDHRPSRSHRSSSRLSRAPKASSICLFSRATQPLSR